MTNEYLQRELAAFDSALPIERAWTPPSSWFTCPELFALEQESVFARTWQPVARTADLDQPGAYVSGVLAGDPWVLVRAHDGTLRAFHNTCRHKGREVVLGSGVKDKLVCGYHAWTYDHDGRLCSAPGMAGIQDFERDEMSLEPIAVETWGAWVFINLSKDPEPLAPRMGGVEQVLGDTPWQTLQYHSVKTWKLECNWKVCVDNYLDGGYHIAHMHPSLDAQLDMPSYSTELFDGYSVQKSLPARAQHESLEFDSATRIGEAARYVWIYPNLMLNRYGPCLDSNLVIPLGPNRCEVRYEFFFEAQGGTQATTFTEESMAQSDVTQREDIEICESVQRGLGSSSYDRGRYAPRIEIGEHHFHGQLAADLQGGLQRRT